jgi:hypothetical protein
LNTYVSRFFFLTLFFHTYFFSYIFLYRPGKKSASSSVPFNGGRDKESLVNGIRSMVEAAGGAVGSVAQLTGSSTWTEQCGEKRVCVLAFLPSLFDENAAKRTERIAALTATAGKVNRGLFRILWSEVGAQPALEASLGISMAPAVVAVSVSKKVYTPYRGPIEASALSKWTNALAVRNEGATPLTTVPEISKVKEWDGKDATPVKAVEEEFSLEDLGL